MPRPWPSSSVPGVGPREIELQGARRANRRREDRADVGDGVFLGDARVDGDGSPVDLSGLVLVNRDPGRSLAG